MVELLIKMRQTPENTSKNTFVR